MIQPDGREGIHPADRRHLQDVPRPLRTHDRQHGLGHPQRAEQVGLDLIARFRFADFLDRAEEPEARVVHGDVDAAETIFRLRHGLEHGGPVRHIEGQGGDAVPVAFDERRERLHVARRRDHLIAACERRLRPHAAETFRRAGNEPDLVRHLCYSREEERGTERLDAASGWRHPANWVRCARY